MKPVCYCLLWLLMISCSSRAQDLSPLDGEKGIFFDRVRSSAKVKVWEHTGAQKAALYHAVDLKPGSLVNNLALASGPDLFILGTLEFVLQTYGQVNFSLERSLRLPFNQVYILEAGRQTGSPAEAADGSEQRLKQIAAMLSALGYQLTTTRTTVPGKCIGIADRSLLERQAVKEFNGSILARDGDRITFKGYRLQDVFDALNEEFGQRLRYDFAGMQNYYNLRLEAASLATLAQSLARAGFSVSDCKVGIDNYRIIP